MMRRWFLLLFLWSLATTAFAAPRSLPVIKSEAEFIELSKTIDGGRYASFPRVMFVIDREGKKAGKKLYFVNTKLFPYHIDFIIKSYLSTKTLEELDKVNYSEPNRRFILGSLVFYPNLKRYGVEFWEGDKMTPDILKTAMTSVQAAFPKPVAFKPNSQPQTDLAATIKGITVLDTNAVYGSRPVLVLNAGKAVGRLRIVERVTEDTVLEPLDIVILKESPLRLSPVAGIITTEFSTPLSHVNLLAKSWRVPNGYVKNADVTYQALAGKMVAMEAKGTSLTLRLATPNEIADASKVRDTKAIKIAKADLSYKGFPALTEQRWSDGVRTGAKAANLGEVAYRFSQNVERDFKVPEGFSIPFAYYADFMRAHNLNTDVEAMLTDPVVATDARRRRAALKSLREKIEAVPLAPGFLQAVAKRRAEIMGTASVFVRSSTNSEDLKGFNGAGLYSSVPNVITDADLDRAIKIVWASVWNDAAFEARMAAGIDHRSVMASVLIQRGMNAQSSGVMITENPFDAEDHGAVFINAKRGLGIRVVEGRRVAEQIIFRPNPESIQVLTRSTDDAMLVFDDKGGVAERPVEPGRAVLTDALARRLAKVGVEVASFFGTAPQDIEWLIIGDVIYIVQSRPYLRGM
jgi:rifampicin phosphotransferase